MSPRPINRHQRRVASGTVVIQDPQRLAKLVRSLLLPDESQRDASRRLGIPQTQLSRMLNAQLRELSPTNVARLRGAVSPGQLKVLRRSLVRRSPASLRRAYLEWVDAQREASSHGSARRWFREGNMLRDEEREPQPVGLSDRDRERQALWQYAQTLAPEIARRMDRALGGTRERKYRDLAFRRILDPLINGPDSGFIEPSWREWRLSVRGRERLRRFIELGIDRERLMLEERPRTSERALNVLTVPFNEFVAIHGETVHPLKKPSDPFSVIAKHYLHGANSD